jgi:hypothetical protein
LTGPEPRPAPSDRPTILVSVEGTMGIDTVDVLARLQLTVSRAGGRVRVHAASAELRRLLDLAGLSDVLGCEQAGLAAGMCGQPETGEQRRVQEVMDVHDPAG